MAYTIHKSDGTSITVADNAIDVSYYNPAGGGGVVTGQGMGTQLVGRNTIDYGAAIAQNFLQITENFSSNTVPVDSVALQGQLWFNKLSSSTGNLYVKVSGASSGGLANWQKIVTVDNSGNSAITGNLAVTGSITSDGHHVPVVFTTAPVPPQVAQAGDLMIVGSVISIFANGNWCQIFPAVYS